MEPDEITQIVSAVAEAVKPLVRDTVDEAIRARMEEVYGVLEELREGFLGTVQVLDGNDQALVGEIQKWKQSPPAEMLAIAATSWERFIRGEVEALGMRMVAPKKVEGDEGEVGR